MKKVLVLLTGIGIPVFIVAMLNAQSDRHKSAYYPGDSKPDIPENIYQIVERSCIPCHSDSSNNFAAKGKLNFTNWNEYSIARKISRLDAVCDVITTGKMPKKKFLKEYPDKALSPEEKEAICKWAAEESDKLLVE
ncbi:MAG: hypothetical protein FJY07_04425 [Bacteroidetes bacterium]|nr:hypothetical protein [Bacteroidota bacterium]